MGTKEHFSSDDFFIVWKFGTIYCLSFRNATYIGTNIGKAEEQNVSRCSRAEDRRLVAIRPTERRIFSTIKDATDQSRDGERLFYNTQQRIFLK